MATYPAESFYRATIRQSIANNTSVPFTLKVSKIPTLTAGLLTISSNTANEEIVEYSGVDGTALTITVVKRGINPASQTLTTSGTDYNNATYQKAHSQNDAIRGDVNHLHIIQDYGNLSTNKLDKSGGLRDTMGIAQDIGATNGSTAITVANTTGWANGATITGTGIPGGTTIVSFVPNTSAVLSAAFTGTTGTVSVIVGKRLLLEIDSNNNEVKKIINPSSAILDADKLRLEKSGGYYEDFTISELQTKLLGTGKINKSFNIVSDFAAGELGFMSSSGVTKYAGEIGGQVSGPTGAYKLITLSETTGVVFAYNASLTTATAFTRSGNTITMGSTITLRSGAFSTPFVGGVALNATTFVAFYGENSGALPGYVRAGTVSGTTITLGAEITVDSGTSRSWGAEGIAKVDTDRFLVGYIGASSARTFVCGSVAGTTITMGTPIISNFVGSFNADALRLAYVSPGKVVAIGDNGSGTYTQTGHLTCSGTTTTAGSGVTFDGGFPTVAAYVSSLGASMVAFASGTSTRALNCSGATPSVGVAVSSGITATGVCNSNITPGGKYYTVFATTGFVNMFITTGTTVVISSTSTLSGLGVHRFTGLMTDGLFAIKDYTGTGVFILNTNRGQIIGSAVTSGTSGGNIPFEIIGTVVTTNSTLIPGIPTYISSTGGMGHVGIKAGPSISATEYISNAQYL